MRNLIATKKARRQRLNLLNDLSQDLATLRDQIAALDVKREAIEARPRPKAEVLDELRADVRAAGRAFDPYLGPVADHAPARLSRQGFKERVLAHPFEAFCALTPDTMMAWAAQQVELLYEDGEDGLSAADRAAALAELDAQKRDLEHAEEACVRAAEKAGLNLLRRGDADPAVVLLPDAELPL